MAYTTGQVWPLSSMDHYTAEAGDPFAARGERFTALRPVYDAIIDHAPRSTSFATPGPVMSVARRSWRTTPPVMNTGEAWHSGRRPAEFNRRSSVASGMAWLGAHFVA
jgi:hypothetical protein